MPQAIEITEKDLVIDFERIKREVAEHLRQFEQEYPELAKRPRTGDEVVRQPIYTYEIHAAS